MAEGKKSVLLYCDLIHTIEKMDDNTAGVFFKHYLRYINDLEPVTDNLVVDLTFESVKQNLKRDLKKWETRAERSRSNGKLGGRPKKDNPEKPSGLINNLAEPRKPDTVNVTVNDTVTDTVNVKDKEINKPKKFVFLKSLLDNGADKELAKEWLLVRKTKKATNTETAFKGFLTQLSKTKLNINQVLRVCIENSWKGFNHDWVKDIKPIALEEEAKELVTFYWEHEGRSNKRTIAKDKAEAYFKKQAVGGYIAVVL